MSRLVRLLYPIIALTLAGTGVVGVLVAGYADLRPILLSAGVGSLVALPISILLARGLLRSGAKRRPVQKA
jgi:hypothetical protein